MLTWAFRSKNTVANDTGSLSTIQTRKNKQSERLEHEGTVKDMASKIESATLSTSGQLVRSRRYSDFEGLNQYHAAHSSGGTAPEAPGSFYEYKSSMTHQHKAKKVGLDHYSHCQHLSINTLPNSSAPLVDQIRFKSLDEILGAQLASRKGLNRSGHNGKHDSAELSTVYQAIESRINTLTKLLQELEEKRLMGIELDAVSNVNDSRDKQIEKLEDELALLRLGLTCRVNGNGSPLSSTKGRALRHRVSQGTLELISSYSVDMDFANPTDLDMSLADMVPHTSLIYTSVAPIVPSSNFIQDYSQEKKFFQFESMVKKLSQELAEAKSALKVVTVELGCLGFHDGPATHEKHLVAIRNAFHQARSSLSEMFPDENFDRFSNGALLDFLVANLRGYTGRMEEYIQMIRRHEEVTALHCGQYRGLLQKLADSEYRHMKLLKTHAETSNQNEERIAGLEHNVEHYHGKVTTLQAQIQQAHDQNTELKVKTQETSVKLVSLTKTLDKSRHDFQELTARFTSLKKDHATTVQKLHKEREETAVAHEMELTRISSSHESAMKDMKEKQRAIKGVESRADEVSKQISSLEKELATIKEANSHEATRREKLKKELQEQKNAHSSLSERLGRLNHERNEIQASSLKLKKQLETERNHRVAAEEDLLKESQRISTLQELLKKTRGESNDLRSQICDLEAELKTTTAYKVEIEERLTSDLAKETKSHKEAKLAIEKHEATISHLRKDVKVLDKIREEVKSKSATLQQRDQYITTLEGKLKHAEQNFTSLHENFVQTKHAHTRKDSMISEFESEINDFRRTSSAHETTIATLHASLYEEQEKSSALRADIVQLEQRHENQSKDHSTFRIEKINEIKKLQKALSKAQEDYAALQSSSQTKELNTSSAIRDKEVEIEELITITETEKRTSTTLRAEIAELQEHCRHLAAVFARTAGFVRGVQEAELIAVRDAINAVDGRSFACKDKIDLVLAEVGAVMKSVEDKKVIEIETEGEVTRESTIHKKAITRVSDKTIKGEMKSSSSSSTAKSLAKRAKDQEVRSNGVFSSHQISV